MSHPIRPDKYQEINNFYTMTVYQKGAEIIRMYHTLLGEEGFQKGMKLYFQRHDGQAVTCDDFRSAMGDANQVDLERFGRWYSQSGTPRISATGEFDEHSRTYTLTLRQHTPATHDQREKQALVIPVAFGLLCRDGREMPLRLAGDDQAVGGTCLLILEEDEQQFVFEDIASDPVPSLLRGFSAPAKLDYPYTSSDLAVLMAHDTDSFVRWEAAQLLAQREILANVARAARGEPMLLDDGLVSAFGRLITDTETDPALVAETMMLPGEEYLAELMDEVDVDGIHAARQFVKGGIANALVEPLLARYETVSGPASYDKSPASMARRSLRSACLSYLLETPTGAGLAGRQLESSDNMTDTLSALHGLVQKFAPSAEAALASFEARWQHDALVMDKWFSIQACVPGARTVERVKTLLDHPGFSLTNPNKVRSLIGAFAMMNPTGFHTADGSGYRLHADLVIELDRLNPQVASRMAAAFNPWTRYDSGRRDLMKRELLRIANTSHLSPDVTEIVTNALAMDKQKPAS